MINWWLRPGEEKPEETRTDAGATSYPACNIRKARRLRADYPWQPAPSRQPGPALAATVAGRARWRWHSSHRAGPPGVATAPGRHSPEITPPCRSPAAAGWPRRAGDPVVPDRAQ